MLKEVAGDILLSEADVIAHGVAANDPMNQGLALQLHERYPAMHKDFHHWCHLSHPKPGSTWLWSGAEGVRIANLITQEGGYSGNKKPGKASVSNVDQALKDLAKIIEKEKIGSVAIPALATGVGGLDWSDVEPVVKKRLADLSCEVFVYTTFEKGVKADERS